MKKRVSLSGKSRLILSMLAVVVPGLIISGYSLVSISQQKRVKELKLMDSYKQALQKRVAEIETTLDDLVARPFRQLADLPINPGAQTGPGALAVILKDLMLANPVVTFPFVMDEDGHFIFPKPRKSSTSFPSPTMPVIREPNANALFRKGEDLELRDRQIMEALKAYNECLGNLSGNDFKPYLFNAIGRCYFKLGKLPQAISYYRDILTVSSQKAKQDNSLIVPVLRQLALCHRRLENPERAVAYYSQLYETVLQAETTGSTSDFTFFKNEALDYLNRRLPASEGASNQDSQKPPETSSSLPEMQLRNYFFEEEAENPGGTGSSNREMSAEALRYLKLREFFLASDAKTQFYRTIKKRRLWETKEPGPQGLRMQAIDDPVTGKKTYVVYRSIGSFIFGFMISPGILNSPVLQKSFVPLPGTHDVKVAIRKNSNDRQGSTVSEESEQYVYAVVAQPFTRFFPGNALALYAKEQGHIAQSVRKDIRLSYIQVAAFVLVLLTGIFLYYKYLTREAELVRLKSQFTDSASHTLKTPLTRIRMLAEKLHLGWVTDDRKKQEYLRTILSETDRMNDMIVNMLDFSKIESGKKHYHLEPLSLPKVVREVLDGYSHYIAGLDFQLFDDIDDNIPKSNLDRSGIKLILHNLLQNAVKYSQDEKIVKVRLYREPEEDAVILEVEDHGIGMERSDTKKVFQRFYRADDNRVQAVEGSGLGLFIVRHAVEAQGGKISVTSRKGTGTTFKISFPLGSN